jgi:hypothetical protein
MPEPSVTGPTEGCQKSEKKVGKLLDFQAGGGHHRPLFFYIYML